MEDKAILCVDDEVIILLSMIQELKHNFGSRFVYEYATNAETALKVIDELAHDNIRVILIISDWLMPGIKGDELLKLVHEKYPGIKAIMITGQADDEAINRVKTFSSVIAVFGKPWNSGELTKVISTEFPEKN